MDPISILIQFVVGIVLTLASNLLSSAPKRDTQEQRRGTRGSSLVGGKVPQYCLVGTIGVRGKPEFDGEWGESSGYPNAHAVDVHSFGDMPISAMIGLFINGERVSFAVSGSDERGNPVSDASGRQFWWQFYDGTQTTTNSYLLDKFGARSFDPWLASMIGRGVPYLVTTAQWDENLWTRLPDVLGEFQGIPLYDVTKDSTAGGSGTHRWDDQSTWEHSDNNAVVLYNIERGFWYNGTHLWGGKKTAAQLPYATWSAAISACNASRTLTGGGTEKMYRCGRRIEFSERPADVIREFLTGCNGRRAETADGTVYILIGIPETADASFTDDDVLASEPLGTIPFTSLDDVINGADGVCLAPEQAWGEKGVDPYYNTDLETEDDGQRFVTGLDLGTVFSGVQAQHCLQAHVRDARRFRKHVVGLPAAFAQYRPLQILAWTSAAKDYTAKLFMITARTRDHWGRVVFGLQEVDPTDIAWDEDTDEKTITFAPITTDRPAPQEVSGFSVAPAVVQDSDGTNRRPGIDVFWSSTSVAIDVESVRVTIATDDGAGGADTTVIDAPAIRPQIGSARFAGDPLLPNQDYVVQIEYIPRSGRETTASAWLQVTTPNVGLSNSDMSAEVNAYRRAGARELDRLRREVSKLALTNGAMDMRNRSQIAVVTDQAFAAVTVESEARVTADEAFASQLTTTISEFNDSFAGTLFKMESIAAADGWDARIAFMVRAGTSDSFAQGGLYMDAKTSGETRMFADFDKFLVRGQMVSVNNVKSIDWDTGDESTIIPDP